MGISLANPHARQATEFLVLGSIVGAALFSSLAITLNLKRRRSRGAMAPLWVGTVTLNCLVLIFGVLILISTRQIVNPAVADTARMAAAVAPDALSVEARRSFLFAALLFAAPV